MGIRKKQRAEAFKAAKKQVAYAKLNNCRIRKRSNHVTVVLGSTVNQPTETK